MKCTRCDKELTKQEFVIKEGKKYQNPYYEIVDTSHNKSMKLCYTCGQSFKEWFAEKGKNLNDVYNTKTIK